FVQARVTFSRSSIRAKQLFTTSSQVKVPAATPRASSTALKACKAWFLGAALTAQNASSCRFLRDYYWFLIREATPMRRSALLSVFPGFSRNDYKRQNPME